MRTLFTTMAFAGLLALAACTTPSKARQTASESASPAQQIQSFFESSAPVTTAEILQILKPYSTSRDFLLASEKYTKQSFETLGVPFSEQDGYDLATWLRDPKNASVFEGIMMYVDDPADDSEQIWKTLNRELRTGKLTKKSQAHLKKILSALEALPTQQGLFFRGTSMPVEFLKQAQAKPATVFTEPGFFSSSLDPGVALRFTGDLASGEPYEGKIKVLMIVRGFDAKPVSALHSFHAAELEMLIKPGARFQVRRVILNQAQNPGHAVVFLEQLR